MLNFARNSDISLFSIFTVWTGGLENLREGYLCKWMFVRLVREYDTNCTWLSDAIFALHVATSSVYEHFRPSSSCWTWSNCFIPLASTSANFFSLSAWILSSFDFISFVSLSISFLIPAMVFLYSSSFGLIFSIASNNLGIVLCSISSMSFSTFSFSCWKILDSSTIGWRRCSPVTHLIQTKIWQDSHCRDTVCSGWRLQLVDATADAIWTRGTTSRSLVAATFLWTFSHPSHNVCLHTVQ